MRLADKMLNSGLRTPTVGNHNWEENMQAILSDVRLSRIVDATNVYRYCREQEPSDLYELPCGAPPHDVMFVEWLQSNGRRLGALGVARTGPFHIGLRTPSGVVGANGLRHLLKVETELTKQLGPAPKEIVPMWLSDNLPDQATWDRIRWVWGIGIFEDDGSQAFGPLARISAALDQWGRLVDVTWQLHVNMGQGTNIDPITLHPFQIFMTTINFMQCANIETVYVDPPAALSRKHRKKGRLKPGQDLSRYYVLKVKPSGAKTRARSRSGPPQDLTAFHSVRGEFHHYGDCCPGLHPPKGLAFGKITGRFWVPAHVRGNPERGVVEKDFTIDV
jgi:hypothetical protein